MRQNSDNHLKLISIDEIKKSFEGYDPKYADDFHSESARVTNKLFDLEIQNFQWKEVVLMCGWSASGKSEFVDKFLDPAFDGLVFDSTFSTIEWAKIKISHVKNSNNRALLYLVIPGNVVLAFRAFHNRERVIPENRFFETHIGSRQTALWVAENYPDIEVRVFESSYEKNEAEDNLVFSEKEFSDHAEMVWFLRAIQYSKQQLQSLLS